MLKFHNGLLIYMLMFGNLFSASVDVEIDILKPQYKPMNILLNDFSVKSPKCNPIVNQIVYHINKDLGDSGAFSVKQGFDAIVYDQDKQLFSLKSFESNEYDVFVGGFCDFNKDSKKFHIRIVGFDRNFKEIFSSLYEADQNVIDKIYNAHLGHLLSDDIYSAVLRIKPYFTSTLLYVSGGNKLMMADYDGNNAKMILKSKGKIYGPQISYNSRYIAYVELIEGISSIYMYDFIDDKILKLGDFQGLSLSPRFSKDDNYLAFSIANRGRTNIVEINLTNKTYKSITNDENINLSGGYSYDDKYMAINSDKTSTPNIYILERKSKQVKKISKAYGSYFNPSFANGINVIVFTKIINKKFQIGLLNLDGEERIISDISEILTESPFWLPDDRHIVYQFSYDKKYGNPLYKFVILDLISGKKLYINQQEDIKDPFMSKINLHIKNNFIAKINLF